MATRYVPGGAKCESRQDQVIFSSYSKVPGFRPGGKQPGRECDTHFHLLLRLRMSGDVPLFLCVPSCGGKGQV